MKNAVIALIEEENGLTEKGGRACINAFRRGGYGFCETRFLYDSPWENTLSAVNELKNGVENLVLVAAKERLPSLANALSDSLKIPFTQGTSDFEGVFTDGPFSMFLLSFEAGAEYAKTVCVPHLDRKYSARRDRIVIRTVGADLQTVRELIKKAERISGDFLSYRYADKYDECVLEIVYDSRAPRMLTDDVLRLMMDGLGDSVYALDDTTLEEQLVTLLKLRGKKIAVAESFTGGGVGKRIVSVSGASEVYYEGINAYSEHSKQIRLGVSGYTINSYGAVSDATAYEMAAGLLSSGGADIAIATTGIAGPKSDRSEQPVGLCYLAVGTKEKIFVYRHTFGGSREEITEKATNHALFEACRLLKNK